MTTTARTPEDHPPEQQRVTIGGGQPLSAAAFAPDRAQTARRCRSSPQRSGPGHRRGRVTNRRAGAAAGRRSPGEHHATARRPVAVRLPAHPGHVADFDVDAAAGIDRRLIDELGGRRYLNSVTNILLIGPPGTGKTHLSVGLARAAAYAGNRTYLLHHRR